MFDSNYNSAQFSSKQTLDLNDVVSLSVSNYGASEATISINGTSRPLPAYDPELKVPFIFSIDTDGTKKKIKLTITFTGNLGNVIVDYSQYVEPKQCLSDEAIN